MEILGWLDKKSIGAGRYAKVYDFDFNISLFSRLCSSEIQMASDGKPVPKIYDMRAQSTAQIQFRMLDAVNVLRSSRSLPSLQLNARLNAAAATHSRDMSVQNRPWHFGSDGSSPLDRARRLSYAGDFLGK